MKSTFARSVNIFTTPNKEIRKAELSQGTAFEDIPDDWTCPLCGVGKEDFEPYEG